MDRYVSRYCHTAFHDPESDDERLLVYMTEKDKLTNKRANNDDDDDVERRGLKDRDKKKYSQSTSKDSIKKEREINYIGDLRDEI